MPASRAKGRLSHQDNKARVSLVAKVGSFSRSPLTQLGLHTLGVSRLSIDLCMHVCTWAHLSVTPISHGGSRDSWSLQLMRPEVPWIMSSQWLWKRHSSIPGSGGSLGEGNGNPLQYSLLGNPLDRGAWQAIVNGLSKSRHNWAARQQQVHSFPGGICSHWSLCLQLSLRVKCWSSGITRS